MHHFCYELCVFKIMLSSVDSNLILFFSSIQQIIIPRTLLRISKSAVDISAAICFHSYFVSLFLQSIIAKCILFYFIKLQYFFAEVKAIY